MQELNAHLDTLISRHAALTKGIEAEAPEAVMGSIERGLRAEQEVLKRQIDEQQRQMQVEAEKTARAIEGELLKIHVPPIQVDIEWRIPPFPGASHAPVGAHTGGIVTGSGIQHFGTGGRVLPFLNSRRGSDTVPAMLTPGEVVLTPGQLAANSGVSHEAMASYVDHRAKLLVRHIRDEFQKVARR
jgi:hypothetical protein